MININEEELNEMMGRLEVMFFCTEIRNMGYKYTDYVFCDIYGDNSYTTSENEAEKIQSILGTSLGDGYVEVTYADGLHKFGVDISKVEKCEDFDEMPFYVLCIKNDLTDKVYKYSLNTKEFIHKIYNTFDLAVCWSDEEFLQIVFEDDLKILTNTYIDISSLLDSYTRLFTYMKHEILKYEERELIDIAS